MADVDLQMQRVQAESRLLWDCLGRSCRIAADDAPRANPHAAGRAVSFLREHLVAASQHWLQEAEMRMRSSHISPAYTQLLADHVTQIKIYQASAPVFWQIASDWVDESPMTAISAVNQDPVEIGYLASILLRYLHGAGRRAGRHGLVPHALFSQRMQDLGGAWHFIAIALAAMLIVRTRILFDLALARHADASALHHDIALLAVPGVRKRLANARELWAPAVLPRIDLLGALPDPALTPYAFELQRQERLMAAVYADGRSTAQDSKQEARLAVLEATTTRKRLEQAYKRVEHLDRLLDVRTTTASAAAAPKPSIVRDDDAQLRQARRDLAAERARNGEQEAELLMLREFCALLLEPPAAPAAAAQHGGTVDVRDARVVLVGGRDRLHQKLRRSLPRGVFVRPDLTACPGDVFEHADCVVFCTEYCSHQVMRGAIELTRRHRLRSGYANHTNPDLVIQTVRQILAA